MIGLVLVTHGRLAEELRAVMEHVVGQQRNVATVCIQVDDDIEEKRAEIRGRILDVETGDGVLLLTDMMGGTPSNLAMSMLGREGVEVIGGVNLPMLVKIAKCRSMLTLAETADKAELAGRKYITTATHLRATCGTQAGFVINGLPAPRTPPGGNGPPPPPIPGEPVISNVRQLRNGTKTMFGNRGEKDPEVPA